MIATSTAAVTLEQALFSSLQSDDNEGYQIAGHSPGLLPAIQRELAAWGPSHDSLQPGTSESGSVNFHALTFADGHCCLSLTRATSGEYSGRGTNVSTWMLLAPPDALATFGHHPLRLFDAALAAGWTASSDVTAAMELVGRARQVNLEAVAAACSVFHPEALAAMVDRAVGNEPLGIVVGRHQRLLVDALFSLLPLEARRQVGFTTALLPSAKRAFRVHLLTPEPEVGNHFCRTTDGQIVDPHEQPSGLSTGARELADLLKQQRWCEVRRRVLTA